MPHDWLVIFQLLSTRKRLLPRLLLSPSCALMNLLPYRNHYLLLLTLSLMPILWGRRREWRCLSSRRGWRRQKRCKKRKMYRDAGKGWLYNCVKIRMKQNEVTSYTYVPVQTIESSMHPPPFICVSLSGSCDFWVKWPRDQDHTVGMHFSYVAKKREYRSEEMTLHLLLVDGCGGGGWPQVASHRSLSRNDAFAWIIRPSWSLTCF